MTLRCCTPSPTIPQRHQSFKNNLWSTHNWICSLSQFLCLYVLTPITVTIWMMGSPTQGMRLAQQCANYMDLSQTDLGCFFNNGSRIYVPLRCFPRSYSTSSTTRRIRNCPSPILSNNRSVLAITEEPAQYHQVKHILHIHYHFIRDAYHQELISIGYIPSADYFHKPLHAPSHHNLHALGL